MRKLYLYLAMCVYCSGICLSTLVANPDAEIKTINISFPDAPKNEQEHQRWLSQIQKVVHDNGYQIKSKDENFGIYTASIPEDIVVEDFIKEVRDKLKDRDIIADVAPDYPVVVTGFSIGLQGQHFSLEQLEALKSGRLEQDLEKQKDALAKKETKTDKETAQLESINKQLSVLPRAKKQLFWHQRIVTTGMRDVQSPSYPFMPHYFSLWDLAPKKGEGIKVCMVDTGVASFTIKGKPAYRKNKDLNMKADFVTYDHNLVSANGNDPIELLTHQVDVYSKDEGPGRLELKQHLIPWVRDYLSTKDASWLVGYLIKYGKPELSDEGQLTQQGNDVLKQLTDSIHREFELVQLSQPVQESVVMQTMPAVAITSDDTMELAGHGSHTFGIVGASLDDPAALSPDKDTGVCGLAPSAQVIMIKSFNERGESNKSTLIAAIKHALISGVDILNMSLKVSDNMKESEEATQLLRRMVNLVPYVIAASGNDGDEKSSRYPGRIESYPGRFEQVEFDVGSFGKDGDDYGISVFSQYEPNVGPKVVAPGFDIISSSLIANQDVDSMYAFLDGTSMAVPMMSGFMALVLGEFKEDFDRRQILAAAYASGVRLHDNDDWRNKVLLGAIDMRTALFTLHVLRYIRKEISSYNIDKDFFSQKYDQLVRAVQDVLFADSITFSKDNLGGIDLKKSMIDYVKASAKVSGKQLDSFYVPTDLGEAIKVAAEPILQAIKPSKQAKKLKIAVDVDAIAQLLQQEQFDLFDWLGTKIRKRIVEVEEAHPYWLQQAQVVKSAAGVVVDVS